MYQVQLTQNQETIQRIIALRYEVLRKPWNKPIETATDELENKSINAYIEINNEIVAARVYKTMEIVLGKFVLWQ